MHLNKWGIFFPQSDVILSHPCHSKMSEYCIIKWYNQPDNHKLISFHPCNMISSMDSMLANQLSVTWLRQNVGWAFPACSPHALSRQRCADPHVASSLQACGRLNLERVERVGCRNYYCYYLRSASRNTLLLRTTWDCTVLHEDYVLYRFINVCFSVKLLLCCISGSAWQPGLSQVQSN